MNEAAEKENKLKCVTADVEDVVYYNEETGYIVLNMSIDDSLFTSVGNMGDVREGERLTMYGDYVTNQKYGKQFRVEISVSTRLGNRGSCAYLPWTSSAMREMN